MATANPATDTNTVTQNETFRTVATAVSIVLPQTSVEARVVLRSDDYGDFIDCGASSYPVGPTVPTPSAFGAHFFNAIA